MSIESHLGRHWADDCGLYRRCPTWSSGVSAPSDTHLRLKGGYEDGALSDTPASLMSSSDRPLSPGRRGVGTLIPSFLTHSCGASEVPGSIRNRLVGGAMREGATIVDDGGSDTSAAVPDDIGGRWRCRCTDSCLTLRVTAT